MKTYELSYQKNIRELGGLVTKDGHHIKYGRLFRGGLLIKLDDNDIEIIKSFNLTDIIDFRSSEEFNNFPDLVFDNVTYYNFPVLSENTNKQVKERTKSQDGNLLWFIEKGESAFEHLKRIYKEFVTTKEGIEAYKKFFEVVLKENRNIYFHCSQGKDRTGFAAYLLEVALGVDEDTAIKDYLLSNVPMETRVEEIIKKVEPLPFYNEQYKQSIYEVFFTNKDYIEASILAMKELYGGTINFIKDVLKVDVEKLKLLYLE